MNGFRFQHRVIPKLLVCINPELYLIPDRIRSKLLAPVPKITACFFLVTKFLKPHHIRNLVICLPYYH